MKRSVVKLIFLVFLAYYITSRNLINFERLKFIAYQTKYSSLIFKIKEQGFIHMKSDHTSFNSSITLKNVFLLFVINFEAKLDEFL